MFLVHLDFENIAHSIVYEGETFSYPEWGVDWFYCCNPKQKYSFSGLLEGFLVSRSVFNMPFWLRFPFYSRFAPLLLDMTLVPPGNLGVGQFGQVFRVNPEWEGSSSLILVMGSVIISSLVSLPIITFICFVTLYIVLIHAFLWPPDWTLISTLIFGAS